MCYTKYVRIRNLFISYIPTNNQVKEVGNRIRWISNLTLLNNFNYMDYSKDYNNDREPIDLHEQAGLLFQGVDEDGRKEWLGTKAQWARYEELERLEGQESDILYEQSKNK